MSLASRHEIERLAGRIQNACRRRGFRWHDGCSTARVWEAAALALIQCHIEDPELPVDPELFVASQTVDNPWTDLASPLAQKRYRNQVVTIIRQLRSELAREIRRAEELIERGRSIGDVVGGANAKLSPLGRYIVARRALRPDLADEWSREALAQHDSCPLYRSACCDFLPVEAYPVGIELTSPASIRTYSTLSSLN
ncbi:hypothetical protein [Paludisphaera rhizosphaerae]|uniref:hypothetical protein n=1 Tax=Paludisphaera rhizosphaerae TaxID=2711216 RepID=UPI0013EC7ED0|nr:hypothetical protein [Paludisphaera rhizosphaerae]